jgi:hypothetical protein
MGPPSVEPAVWRYEEQLGCEAKKALSLVEYDLHSDRYADSTERVRWKRYASC